MKDRDQQFEDNDEYRRKICYSVFELEGTVNQVGKKQDILINAVQLNSEIYAKGKEIPSALEKTKI